MTGTTVERHDAEGIATLVLSRPEAGNPLDRAALHALGDALDDALGDPSVGALLVTGAGTRAFVAGADVAELAGLDPAAALELSLLGQAVLDRLERGGKPSLAAVNGPALGGGCELALACHFRVMARDAVLALPEVGLGLVPGFGGTQRLARLVGRSRALEVVLAGRRLSATEAEALGLVAAVVPREEVVARGRELLGRVLAQGPVAVRLALEAVTAGLDLSQDDGAHLEATLFGLAFSTEDAREGTRAFLEKRPPRFQGR